MFLFAGYLVTVFTF